MNVHLRMGGCEILALSYLVNRLAEPPCLLTIQHSDYRNLLVPTFHIKPASIIEYCREIVECLRGGDAEAKGNESPVAGGWSVNRYNKCC